MKTFRSNRAVIIGIDDYQNGVAPLRSAVWDAQQVAAALGKHHGFEVQLLLDEQASLTGLCEVFGETLPARVGDADRLLVYFAGHGIALDGDDGPEGFLVPQDARPEERASLLPMKRFHDALVALPCRHLFLLLDWWGTGRRRIVV